MSDNTASPIDSAHFRNVFGHLPTGVVVVTGVGAQGEMLGVTIGSFASISLAPPLAGFYIGRKSRTWPLIAASGKFCANVLSATQTELCWRFAKDGNEDSRFAGLVVARATNGAPVLPGVIATVECSVHATHEVGDHDFVVGAVTNLVVHDQTSAAMVFYKGKTGNARIDS